MTRRPATAFALGAAVILAVAATTLAIPSVQAQTAIKVVVNDQAITSYDIAQRARLIQLTSGSKNATQAATQELIDDALKLSEAKRMRVNVTDKEVDEAFASIAERLKMGPAQLSKALSGSGVNPATLRSRLKAQIAWSQLVRQQFQRNVSIGEQDVIRALREKEDSADKKTTVEYSLARIVFVVPANAPAGRAAQRQKEAEALRGRFNGCEQGLEFAKALPEVVVQPTFQRLGADLTPQIVEILEATGVGRLTPPEKSESGYDVIAVCNRREISSDYAARQDMQAELRTAEGEVVSRRYLRDVRANAVIEYR